MPLAFADRLKASFGITEEDAANVRALARIAEPEIPAIVDRFYEELLRTPEARKIFWGGMEQVRRLQGLLREWLREVFAGTYDGAYLANRLRIGHTHVRVGLPQPFMLLGIELVWRELERRITAAAGGPRNRELGSLHKVLMMDLAVMLESYQEGMSEQIRQTERTAVEEKLTRAEHLAEIGQLAASLAHEIKNPLAGISGAIQIIRETIPRENPHRAIVDEILAQIDRLDATVKDLLFYARPNPPRATTVSLSDIVSRVMTVLREEPAMQPHSVDLNCPDGRALVFADEGQLEQLVMNLLLNAAQASPRQGLIRVETADSPGGVRLVISDNGPGMPSHIRDRAFEPFFTTKSKGTGLGLSICRRIVDAHGGNIQLRSEPGRGTQVVVEFPAWAEESEAKIPA